MDSLKLITQYSLWFLLLCALAGALYAYLLYSKKYSWGKKINTSLFAIRFLLVFILCFLLLGPYIKRLKNHEEDPSIVFAIDNSQSISNISDSAEIISFKNNLGKTITDLTDNKVTVEIRTLDKIIPTDSISNLKFNKQTSNLSKLLKEIQSDYTNRNLASVILITDGIYNEGIAPNFLNIKNPIYTVGLGDTLPKKDINVKSLLYNKITYSGNKFPIVAEVHNSGFEGKTISVYLKQKNKVIAKQTFPVKSKFGISEINFNVSSETAGLQHYVVEVEKQPGEFTSENNSSHAYVEVVEGKEKILLVATSPHPDIKALKTAIEKKENYELQIYIPGINDFKPGKFDLVIFHQIPDLFNTARELKEKFLKDETSLLFIVGGQTNLNIFNNENKTLKISGSYNQSDNVFPSFNPAFNKFKFESEDVRILGELPPLSVPFGNYIPSAESEVVLYQKIGSLPTQKPILIIGKSRKKIGVIIGEGLWKWPLHEFKLTQDTKTFEKLITNTIQFLSSKEDKRKFRFYSIQNEFSITDPILFETETYNDIYEKIYGQKVDVKISDEGNNVVSYSFENGENNPRFEIKGLQEGIYKYVATTTILGNKLSNKGEFSIKAINLETSNTTADHNLLRLVSNQSGGTFLIPSEIRSLVETLKKDKLKSIIHTSEEFNEIINLPLIGIFLLLLACTEWFLRKFKGGY